MYIVYHYVCEHYAILMLYYSLHRYMYKEDKRD
jgi:hypothetical protein